jgi:hypothetical protein
MAAEISSLDIKIYGTGFDGRLRVKRVDACLQGQTRKAHQPGAESRSTGD